MTYLVEARHMSMIKVGIFQALPFIGATIGILVAGYLSDFFIRRGVSISTARKAPLINRHVARRVYRARQFRRVERGGYRHPDYRVLRTGRRVNVLGRRL